MRAVADQCGHFRRRCSILFAGKAVENYDVDYARAVSAIQDTLESLKIAVNSTVGDEIKTVITAKCSDQSPVTVKVLRLSPGQVQVGIRTGPVGITELDASRSIQAQLKDRLARTTPPESPVAADRLRSPQADPSVNGPQKRSTLKMLKSRLAQLSSHRPRGRPPTPTKT